MATLIQYNNNNRTTFNVHGSKRNIIYISAPPLHKKEELLEKIEFCNSFGLFG